MKLKIALMVCLLVAFVAHQANARDGRGSGNRRNERVLSGPDAKGREKHLATGGSTKSNEDLIFRGPRKGRICISK